MITSEDIEVISVIPRCQTCNRPSMYIIKNKKTGETKYFCKLCGKLKFLNYMNGTWEIIELK